MAERLRDPTTLLVLLVPLAACSKLTEPDAGSFRGKAVLEGDRDQSGERGFGVSSGRT